MLSKTAAAALFDIARDAIRHAVHHQSYTPAPREEKSLNERSGCFVTIKQHQKLRGCIGNFQSRRPLYQEVAEMAVAAATQDPRFAPLSATEFEEIELEITILSSLERISDPAEITIGVHGIYLENGFHRGVLLPQVATDHHWDVLTFLKQTCVKAGLSEDQWQSPQTEIYRFSGQILSESDI